MAMGVEVRYLAYPRAGIDSDSFRKIATAWCAKSPQETLTDIKNGDNVPFNVCSGNPVAEHYRLGGELGVTGTPAIVLMDGTMIPGYQTAKAFAKMLAIETSIEKLETDIKDGNDFLVSIETQEKMLKSEKIDLAVWNFILGLVEKNDKLQN